MMGSGGNAETLEQNQGRDTLNSLTLRMRITDKKSATFTWEVEDIF